MLRKLKRKSKKGENGILEAKGEYWGEGADGHQHQKLPSLRMTARDHQVWQLSFCAFQDIGDIGQKSRVMG